MKRKPESFIEWLGQILSMVVVIIALGTLAIVVLLGVIAFFGTVFAGFASPLAALIAGG